MSDEPIRRRAAAWGALLFALAMPTGVWAGLVLSGVVVVPIAHLALAAHLNGLLGCFWLLGVSYTVPMLAYGEQGKSRLVWATAVPAYGNWAITLLASVLGATGLGFTGNAKNNLVAALLDSIVVLPTLVASAAWAWGLRPVGSSDR